MRRHIPRSILIPIHNTSIPSSSLRGLSRISISATSRVEVTAHTFSGARRLLHATAQQLLKPMDVMSSTTTNYPTTHDKIENVQNTPYFLDNKFVQSKTDRFIDLPDPATNNLVTRVPEMTTEEMKAVVASAEKAYQPWRNTSIMARQQIMFRFVHLIRENWDRLAASIVLEQGKTFADAKGDVLRGLQVAEHAVAATEFLKGEVLEVAKDMETRTYREPLGVTAAICPFSTFTLSGTC